MKLKSFQVSCYWMFLKNREPNIMQGHQYQRVYLKSLIVMEYEVWRHLRRKRQFVNGPFWLPTIGLLQVDLDAIRTIFPLSPSHFFHSLSSFVRVKLLSNPLGRQQGGGNCSLIVLIITTTSSLWHTILCGLVDRGSISPTFLRCFYVERQLLLALIEWNLAQTGIIN